jgi:ABC-2 type transport system ATP-binding protein
MADMVTGTGSAQSLAVEVEGLRKRFGATVALDGVDLVVETGQIYALLGPNGAGKTTLVRILATLLAPDSGAARVAGYNVVSQPAKVRAVIGLTGQFTAIDDLLSGRENLEMTAELYHLPRRDAVTRSAALLERFGLIDAAGRQARTYSGGMRRRLDLAACLIARPPVVVLDEPTTGLDPASRLGLWEVISDLARSGTTVLLTTQYLEEADRLASRIAVIDGGRIIAEGTADELKENLGGEVVELRAASDGDLDELARVLADHSPRGVRLDRPSHRATLPAPAGPSTLMAVLRDLDRSGVTVEDIGLRRPSLDDVFLHLTGHPTRYQQAPLPHSAGVSQ